MRICPFAKALIAANADRIVWGTDWPHPDSTATHRPAEVAPLLAIDDGLVLNQLACGRRMQACGSGYWWTIRLGCTGFRGGGGSRLGPKRSFRGSSVGDRGRAGCKGCCVKEDLLRCAQQMSATGVIRPSGWPATFRYAFLVAQKLSFPVAEERRISLADCR